MTLPVQEPVFIIGRCAWATVRSAHLRPGTTSKTEFTETTLHQRLQRQGRSQGHVHVQFGAD